MVSLWMIGEERRVGWGDLNEDCAGTGVLNRSPEKQWRSG